MQIHPATEQQDLDSKRLLLHLNQHGTVLSVSNATPKTLFGFRPTDLIGQPLEAFVNAFEQCKASRGNTSTLLMQLASRSDMEPDASYRVGVKDPNVRGKASSGGTASFLEAVRKRDKVSPAIMKLALIEHEDDDDVAAAAGRAAAAVAAAGAGARGGGLLGDGADEAVLAVQLWRADTLSCTLEADRHLVVTKADAIASMVFGMPQKSFMQMHLTK